MRLNRKKIGNLAKIFATAALAAGALTGCSGFARQVDNQSVDTDRITYDVDLRTGECFAEVFYAPDVGDVSVVPSITDVPCTEKVLEQIAQTKPDKVEQYRSLFAQPKPG
jgi:hypothetical protein